jgi:hypothetical protein
VNERKRPGTRDDEDDSEPMITVAPTNTPRSSDASGGGDACPVDAGAEFAAIV